MLLAPACVREMVRTLRFGRGGNVWQALRHFRDSVPKDERDRLAVASQRELFAVDATHPPTSLRVELIRSAQPSSALVAFDTAWSAQVDRELNDAAVEVTRQLQDEVQI
jgi:hypothetical protein